MSATVFSVGASGYAGQELDRVLGHPELELLALGSDSYAGLPASALDPRLGRKRRLAAARVRRERGGARSRRGRRPPLPRARGCRRARPARGRDRRRPLRGASPRRSRPRVARVVPLEVGFRAAAAELAADLGALLCLDDVQTGVGRMGTFFAFERLGVEPDLVGLARRDAGLLVLTAGEDVLRLAPPLTVSADEVELALATLAQVLA